MKSDAAKVRSLAVAMQNFVAGHHLAFAPYARGRLMVGLGSIIKLAEKLEAKNGHPLVMSDRSVTADRNYSGSDTSKITAKEVTK